MKRVGQIYREALIKTVRDRINANKSIFVLSYTKLSSPRVSELRKDLKKAGANVFVSRNSLARIALKELKQEPLAERLSGQTAFVWSDADAAAISKILVKFAKECKTFAVQGGLLEGNLLDQAQVQRFSELPSREVLLAQLLGTIQAPLTRLAGVLNAKSREILSILKQLSEQKGGNQ
ncbi:MAG TPA: 50S ribosomal protein L10 [Candidatus Omnitrophota bacterium]|nr:50S ribosomal protein L10 [Candidatus Omnitrophota bacterium]